MLVIADSKIPLEERPNSREIAKIYSKNPKYLDKSIYLLEDEFIRKWNQGTDQSTTPANSDLVPNFTYDIESKGKRLILNDLDWCAGSEGEGSMPSYGEIVPLPITN